MQSEDFPVAQTILNEFLSEDVRLPDGDIISIQVQASVSIFQPDDDMEFLMAFRYTYYEWHDDHNCAIGGGTSTYASLSMTDALSWLQEQIAEASDEGNVIKQLYQITDVVKKASVNSTLSN